MNADRLVEIVKFKYPDAKVGYHRDKGSGGTVIDVWVCSEHPAEPTKDEIKDWKKEFKDHIKDEKAARKFRKEAIATKLELSAQDIIDLRELIIDGNID